MSMPLTASITQMIIMLRPFLILCLFTGLAYTNEWTTCGYDACPIRDPYKINIHLVAHSHMDVGWLKTVDQYYYGLKTEIQRAGVQYTMDTVVDALTEHPERRFMLVETAFFWMWWRRQDSSMQKQVRALVNSGVLEFISGGWSMNDEGDTHYNPTIDHMTWGHRVLQDAFGKCAVPKIAWQIDPFGHSQEQAALFAQMSFDGLFFGRLDWNDKSLREKEKRMEFLWKASSELGSAGSIFTGVLPNLYMPPSGFDFDDLTADDGIVNDPESEEYNVPQKVAAFFQKMDEQAKHYATDNLMITMGADFEYQNAPHNFNNLDLLIKYVNAEQANGSRYNLFYSTPTCYLKSLHDANRTWTSKSDDFFPYASDQHAYFTGYFTSRPAFKLQERKANAFLQTCKQLQSLAGFTDSSAEEAGVEVLKRAMGIAQHHDAITGTEKQRVANDYALQLNKGILQCQQVIDHAFSKLAYKTDRNDAKLRFCPKLNVSECDIVEKEGKVAIILYNPRSQDGTERISFPWSGVAYSLKLASGQEVPSDMLLIPPAIRKLPERVSNTTHEIVFMAKIPALGFTTFFLERTSEAVLTAKARNFRPRSQEVIKLKGKSFTAVFDASTGDLKSISMADGKLFNVKQSYLYYKGMAGNNMEANDRASGAYIFRPNGTQPIPVGNQVTAEFVRGKIASEVRQVVSNYVSQVIRVSPDSDFIEFDWLVGPIPVEDKVGREIISRFTIEEFKTDNTFYTDANGRQIVKRVKDHRETWQYSGTEPVAGNYYPVNSRIFVRDEKQGMQLTVLTDRTQGGSGLSDGTIELMIHRRLLHDDGFGVDEALNEPGFDKKGLIVRGKHRLFLSKISEAKLHRDLALSMYLEPQVFINSYSDVKEYTKQVTTEWSGLREQLPANVHLLTLEEGRNDSILLRLEHFYDSKDDPDNLSKAVSVSLSNIFKPFTIVSAEERTLTANQLLSEAKRLDWRSEDSGSVSMLTPSLHAEDLTIELKPMEIRTLIVKVKATDAA